MPQFTEEWQSDKTFGSENPILTRSNCLFTSLYQSATQAVIEPFGLS